MGETCCTVGARPDASAIDAAIRRGDGLGTICKRHAGLINGCLGIDGTASQPAHAPQRGVVTVAGSPGQVGYVYFAQDETRRTIKIGRAMCPPARVGELQTANSAKLRLLVAIPAMVTTEAELHRRFASCHLRGEWFWPGPELVAFIDGATIVLKHTQQHTEAHAPQVGE